MCAPGPIVRPSGYLRDGRHKQLSRVLQDVDQIQDQGDVQSRLDSNLEGTLAISQGDASFGCGRIAALHLFGHFLDDGSLALEPTGPHSLVLGTRGNWRVRSPAPCRKQTFDDLFWGTHPRRAGEDGSYRCHSLLVGLLPFSQP